jgi:four helix bundle protein
MHPYRELGRQLAERTRHFAVQVIFLCRQFPRSTDGYVVAKQLIKAATGTAANYRASCRSRSRDDFVSRMSIVAEEADESQFWLDVAIASGMVSREKGSVLLAEASELTAIFTTSRNTAKRSDRRTKSM